MPICKNTEKGMYPFGEISIFWRSSGGSYNKFLSTGFTGSKTQVAQVSELTKKSNLCENELKRAAGELFKSRASASRTAHLGLSQPQLSGSSIWVGFFESLKQVKISYIVIEFQNRSILTPRAPEAPLLNSKQRGTFYSSSLVSLALALCYLVLTL